MNYCFLLSYILYLSHKNTFMFMGAIKRFTDHCNVNIYPDKFRRKFCCVVNSYMLFQYHSLNA